MLYSLGKEEKYRVTILISNIAVFIFQHNCLFNYTSFFSFLNEIRVFEKNVAKIWWKR